MAAVDDPKTLGRTRLSFADEAEIDEFAATLDKFERGEITPDQWRAYRLVRGNYGQRQDDVQMLRVKIPQGILDAPQLAALADVADTWSRGFGHITTRQNVQFHFMQRPHVELAMRRVAEAGLTTREACGSSVRNITGCPYTGVAADEVFDVTPYAEAMTRYLLRHPLSSALPRKFKIAFEGCASEDHALTAINDIGLRARLRGTGPGAVRGFHVRAGGGTSTLATPAAELYEFLPAGEILEVAEAILRVYARLGDYKHKQRNRMKFLIREMGWEAWRAEFDKELFAFRAEGGAPLSFPPDQPGREEAPDWPRPDPPSVAVCAAQAAAAEVRGPGLVPEAPAPVSPAVRYDLQWASTNVRPQKQAGFSLVTVMLPLGDVTGAQLRLIGDLALAYGDGTVRTTVRQGLLFRWVRSADVPDLYRRLRAAGLGQALADTVADVTSCPGAESCRLAVTQSRGLGRQLGDHLRSRPDLVAAAPDLVIKISGCPNGCGQHHVAGIGFQGSVRKVDGKALPQYFLMVGGGVDDSGAHYARLAAKVPVRRIETAVERLIELYRSERETGETATTFFRRVELGRVKQLVSDLERVRPEEAAPADFVDLGEETAFEVTTMDGECSA
ncbi:MAG TPA: nitrite/sulfite reductase [Vicinamibacteria bacterium]|nr:nitrite/sulfite reductase [Vicinamibacteria bacterium]